MGRLLPGPRSAAGPALYQLFIGAEGAFGIVLEAVLRVHRLPETVLGRGYLFDSVEAGLDAMREVMQAGLRPLVMRLYDPDDSAFQGVEDGCLLVVAAAGPRAVAESEAAARFKAFRMWDKCEALTGIRALSAIAFRDLAEEARR